MFIGLKSYNFKTIFDKEMDLSDHFKSPYILPENPIQSAFLELTSKMKECLYGRSESKIHLMSADCGTGKSATVQNFIHGWKREGFPGHGSVIVMLPSNEEIDNYVSGCRLDLRDYACISSDRKFSGYGLGAAKACNAKVLFVTHEQARRRMAEKGGFEAIEPFHYKGRPRALRIWEESLNPAFPVTFLLHDLEGLPGQIHNADLANAIDALRLDNGDRRSGHVIHIPPKTAELAGKYAIAHRGMTKAVMRVLEGLRVLGGCNAVLRENSRGQLILLGSGMEVPADLAPLIVLDASARLKANYQLWATRNKQVVRLPQARADYRKAVIHWWDRGAGKISLRQPELRREILEAVAGLANTDANERWLVIYPSEGHPKDDPSDPPFVRELKSLVKDHSNLSFRHWGKHKSSNDHKHIKKVIIVGAQDFGQQAYEAIYAAASGSLAKARPHEIRSVSDGEFADNVYQAACRSNLRNVEDGIAGNATVYLTTASRKRRQPMIEKAFTNCVIEEWLPVATKPKGKALLVIDAMKKLFRDETCTVIQTKALWQACGGKSSSYLTRHWKNKGVIEFMKAHGISRKGNLLLRCSTAAFA